MIIEYWSKVKSFVKWLIPFCVALFLLLGCSPVNTQESQADKPVNQEQVEGIQSSALPVEENGSYTSKEDVAFYIHIYGKLPENFITKKEAEAAGWVSREGNLPDVAPGKSIGGSPFGNYEGSLPEKDGREWYECDINYDGGFRGAERLVYSNDGLIYYTADHYKTFEQLY